jgi:hypothetical protein
VVTIDSRNVLTGNGSVTASASSAANISQVVVPDGVSEIKVLEIAEIVYEKRVSNALSVKIEGVRFFYKSDRHSGCPFLNEICI